ncbi:hypothetical protein KW787_02730 [Candidatus Pacearchaeota archaeon]|nr:hypothetical protein [Candidatus Pacearchaeota archaeon]
MSHPTNSQRNGKYHELLENVLGEIKEITSTEEGTIIHFDSFKPHQLRDNPPNKGVRELVVPEKDLLFKVGDYITARVLAADRQSGLDPQNEDTPIYKKRRLETRETALYIEKNRDKKKFYGFLPENTPVKIID